MIGVLDLQGGVFEHLEHLRFLDVECRAIKRSEELAGLSGLIIPGGESTCLSRLFTIFGFTKAIKEANKQGLKLWGTCAGAILIASQLHNEKQPLMLLGALDITLERNSFGSQLESFEISALVPAVAQEPLPLVFIRAPKIVRAGAGVKVLLKIADYIAAAENETSLATVFHPELTNNNAFHRYFAAKCGERFNAAAPLNDPHWRRTSWMKECSPCGNYPSRGNHSLTNSSLGK